MRSITFELIYVIMALVFGARVLRRIAVPPRLLSACPQCRYPIVDKETRCPECGAHVAALWLRLPPEAREPIVKEVWPIVVVVLALAGTIISKVIANRLAAIRPDVVTILQDSIRPLSLKYALRMPPPPAEQYVIVTCVRNDGRLPSPPEVYLAPDTSEFWIGTSKSRALCFEALAESLGCSRDKEALCRRIVDDILGIASNVRHGNGLLPAVQSLSGNPIVLTEPAIVRESQMGGVIAASGVIVYVIGYVMLTWLCSNNGASPTGQVPLRGRTH